MEAPRPKSTLERILARSACARAVYGLLRTAAACIVSPGLTVCQIRYRLAGRHSMTAIRNKLEVLEAARAAKRAGRARHWPGKKPATIWTLDN